MVKKLKQRFEELETESKTLEGTKHGSSGIYESSEYIDNEQFLTWKVKVKNLLVSACGENSQHFSEFLKNEKRIALETNLDVFQRLKAVFQAAKEDFSGGYLVSVKKLVQAEVFDSELEQAKELLQSGYKLASAVIAGVVLETALRDLCDQEKVSHGKLDKMNSDLAKAGIYNKLQQKRITALADIRNSAAHGKPEDFSDQDVELMIRDVENFLLQHMV